VRELMAAEWVKLVTFGSGLDLYVSSPEVENALQLLDPGEEL
jgi:hypothetical protein